MTHVGGVTSTAGDAAEADRLAHALTVSPATEADDDPARGHVHGFHTYPARMHPTTAARLVEAFVPAKGRVLDPFCGSGTVLVEAMVTGRRPMGVDLNPLAVRLAWAKTRPRQPADLDRALAMAKECAAHADQRRKARSGATRRFPHEDVALFEPHVLLELDSLRAKIEQLPDTPERADLWLILSSLLVKLSRRRGDTSADDIPRRTAAGFTAKLFLRKTEEWTRRLVAFARLLPSPAPLASVYLDDATTLGEVLTEGVDAIVTSPPYAATYDYLDHHALRLRWLGLDDLALSRGELGARAAYKELGPAEARRTWLGELCRFLGAARRVLPRSGPAVLLLADSAVGGIALRADEIMADIAPKCGFIAVARASQPRPHFHGLTAAAFQSRPRAEHAIVLRKR